MRKYFLLGLVVTTFFTGCAKYNEEVTEFNKPALYWYKHIAKNIAHNSLDRADALYVSMRSEHMRSNLMPTAIMMLAHAHMNNEEYLLSSYYLDEYRRRYGESKNREYIEFMKLKASFMGVKDVYRDQKLIMSSINKAKAYVYRYPSSQYNILVNTMLIRLQMSQHLLNENIAALYDRTNKPDAAKIYRGKNKDSVVKMTDIEAPKKSLIGKIFD